MAIFIKTESHNQKIFIFLFSRATRTRERREPIRYRHSIGSPSYSVQDTRSDEQQNSTDPSFGAEETERFFLNLKGTTTPTDRADCEEVIEAQEFPRNMQAAYDEYINRPKKSKTVLAQRDTRYFWNILFRQNFDLASEDVKVRFAGEAAADDGGPLKEFLTLSMKIFKECNLCFGNKECALRSSPDDPENRFYKLGQITGLSILITGRGPECLHPAVVRAIFDVDQPQEIEPIEDGLINERIDEIKNGLYEALYEQNINPSNKTTNELIRLFLISAIVNSHFFAIHKFRSGIISISPNILDCSNFESNKKCLEYSTAVEYTFEEMISLFIYPQTTNLDADEATSNFMDRIRIAISEFELFLLDVGHGNVIIEDETLLTFHDILLLLTGCDRIPPSGLEKKIEVFFADDISYPKISTCGLIFTLPIQTKNFQTMMVNSVKFGGVGFGDI